MPTAGETRQYIVEEYQKLLGRMPTSGELLHGTHYIMGGTSREAWLRTVYRAHADAITTNLYQQVLGRAPTAGELSYHSNGFAIGRNTVESFEKFLSTTSEALLKTPEEVPDPDAEDAAAYLTKLLDTYGLSGMGGWAWDQIQQGYSEDRIFQNLRETDQYKQRFVGMELRRKAGLSAISEAEYIAYERDVRQLMRAAGLPAGYYDSPDDFANFIGMDVSPAEIQWRINEGYLAASQAPAEVRSELERLYGVTQGQLAAFFLDPDKALPLIQQQFQSSQISAAAVSSSYGGLTAAEAERLASLGVSQAQAQQGFSTLAGSQELFQELPGEQEGLISRETQQAAVFAGDASAVAVIEQRAGARRSAGSGAQSFSIGQGGAGGLSRE